MFIENLKDHKSFRETVIDRIWQTWSKSQGFPRSVAEQPVNRSLAARGGVPLCLVAHDGHDFQGTLAMLDSDPDYPEQHGPWVDALWVEPTARGTGLASNLLDRAIAAARTEGHSTVFLEALPHLLPFYSKNGWSVVGRAAKGGDLSVMRYAMN